MTIDITIEGWEARARCANSGENFITPGNHGERLLREYCAHCPVKVECAKAGVTVREGGGIPEYFAGIWGGVWVRTNPKISEQRNESIVAMYRVAGVEPPTFEPRVRQATADECRNGHPRTEANTYMTRGYKACRTCHAEQQRKYDEKRKRRNQARQGMAL